MNRAERGLGYALDPLDDPFDGRRREVDPNPLSRGFNDEGRLSQPVGGHWMDERNYIAKVNNHSRRRDDESFDESGSDLYEY